MSSVNTAAAANALKNIGRSFDDLLSNEVSRDAGGNEILLYRYEGRLLPPFGDLAISKLKDLEIRDDDILIEGYPKTGCNWMHEILSMVVRRSATSGGKGKEVAFLELASKESVDALPSRRVLNTHVWFDQLPKQVLTKKTKIVLTIRNPKDTLVSFYNHHVNFDLYYKYKGKYEDYFDVHMNGKVDYEDYFDYYMDFQKNMEKHKDLPVIVMSYEDMKEDLPREIRRLAKFLEIDLGDDLVEAIAKMAGFESMVKMDHVMPIITRKGQVGDWKGWFTVAQNERMDAAIKAKMSDLTIYTPRYTLP